MNITVVICTYNRCDSLRHTLASVAVLTMSEDTEWEILVVDNNSTDHTRAVVEQAGPPFRYLFEPKQGKSFALNAGISAAKGEILAFLDDDVIVHQAWLDSLTRMMRKDKAIAGAGGRTKPFWGGYTLPTWLSIEEPYNSGGILAALFDLGDHPGRLDKPPYGTNMAFRREMFEKYGMFRTHLGPRPGNLIRSEDTEFGLRLLAAGETLWYEPSAIVYHPVLPERLNMQYYLNWWYDYGRADAREWELAHSKYLTIGKILITVTVPTVLRWLLSLSPVKRFYMRSQVRKTLGWINELRGVKPREKRRVAATLERTKSESTRPH